MLIGFNEWSTIGVAYAIKELNLNNKVFGIGFDSNVNCVNMLESGEIDTLIVQNPFLWVTPRFQKRLKYCRAKNRKQAQLKPIPML